MWADIHINQFRGFRVQWHHYVLDSSVTIVLHRDPEGCPTHGSSRWSHNVIHRRQNWKLRCHKRRAVTRYSCIGRSCRIRSDPAHGRPLLQQRRHQCELRRQQAEHVRVRAGIAASSSTTECPANERQVGVERRHRPILAESSITVQRNCSRLSHPAHQWIERLFCIWPRSWVVTSLVDRKRIE